MIDRETLKTFEMSICQRYITRAIPVYLERPQGTQLKIIYDYCSLSKSRKADLVVGSTPWF